MNENSLIVKANSLIESRCNLTLNQQKLVLSVIAQIEKDDVDFHEYILSIADFKRLMDIKSTGNYKAIKEVARDIRKKDLIIEKDGSTLITGWFSSIEIDHEGAVGFLVDPKLKPYLLQLKSHFTAYQIRNILRLKSRYSIRVYELLKQYQKIGDRVFEVSELRNLLFIEPEKYTRFDNFRARVLNPAKREINKETDLLIDYETIKQGRTVKAIKFTIERQERQESAQVVNQSAAVQEIPQAIMNLIPEPERGDHQKACQQILQTEGENALLYYIEKAKNRPNKTESNSFWGYVLTIYKLGLYGKFQQEQAEIEKALKAEQAREEADQAAQAKLTAEQAELKRAGKEVQEMIEALTPGQLASLDAFIEQQNLNNAMWKRFQKGRRDGLRVQFIKEFQKAL